MRFSEKWLREWVDPPVDSDTLCEQLTMAGLEVDAVEGAAPALDRVVVARIDSVEPHPEADRLRLCRVDAGDGEARQVVCGADNADAGLLVPLALPGARLPGGVAVGKGRIRGQASDGMLCSAAELGLGEGADGLVTLDADAAPGASLTEHLRLDDRVIEIDLTPNRGDCLSLRGVAREVGVWNRVETRPPHVEAVGAEHDERVPVRIDDPSACRRYVGRVITGVDPGARTPDWMRERLRRAGIRAISPLVDVTNYVMIELGQPMHAFDRARLKGGIAVRRAAAGESILLLDGERVELHESTPVIADESGPVAIAGLMGGEPTAVGPQTRDIFLESACFPPAAVAGQSRLYKRHTDSSHRFERGVDPVLQALAAERATGLIVAIAGGDPGPLVTVSAENESDRATTDQAIRLRGTRIERLLGVQIDDEEVVDILRRLDMHLTQADAGRTWNVTPPSFRYDIAREADLIEEVARIHGYERLPGRAQKVEVELRPEPEARRTAAELRTTLVQRGYHEAITYSFVDAELQAQLTPGMSPVDLDNPIAEPYAQMRTTLWSSLLPAWLYNQRRQQARIRLFEIGLRFARVAEADMGIEQRPVLAGLVAGHAEAEHWDRPRRDADFFDLKGDVEALLALGPGIGNCRFEPSEHPALHPGRSAAVRVDDRIIGHLGQVHPKFKKTLENSDLPYVFELEYEELRRTRLPRYEAWSDYPSIRRDLALAVPEAVSAGELQETIVAAELPALVDLRVFDVFRGGDLETGFKSVALGLIFQDKTRTLTDDEVDAAVTRLADRLEREWGARIRGR